MKKLAAAVIAAVIALSAAGCSASGGATDKPAGEPAPSAAPITMAPEEPAATPTDEASKYQIDEATYLRGVTEAWHGDIPSDDQLIAAGQLACQQLAAGTPEDGVSVVEGDGEDATWNNKKVVTYAIQAYCVEYFN